MRANSSVVQNKVGIEKKRQFNDLATKIGKCGKFHPFGLCPTASEQTGNCLKTTGATQNVIKAFLNAN